MGNVLEGGGRQIRLAGHNRMAMLLFSVQAGGARCALNVFKVREVLRCPPITPLLGQNAQVAGSVDYRGKTIPAIDMALALGRSEEHTSELQSLMRISYAVFCLKKKKKDNYYTNIAT